MLYSFKRSTCRSTTMSEEDKGSDILKQAKSELNAIYETTLQIFEVPYDQVTKKPIARTEPLTDEEHDRILDRVQVRIKRLRAKTQTIQDELNMSHDSMISFLENPNNFTPDQWEILQEMRAQIDSFRSQVVDSLGGKRKKMSGKGRKQASSFKKKMKQSKRLAG